MDFQTNLLLSFLAGLSTLLIIIFHQWRKKEHRKRNGVPQAGGALPIIGHIHLLGGGQLTHKTLGAMAENYGPIFTLRLGSHQVLVVSSWEMAKECFTTLDRVFSTRPSIAASRLLGYDFAMFGFAPYGPYWREMRRIATLELLSNRRIDLLKHIRVSEVKTWVKELYDLWVGGGSDSRGVLVDMKRWFGDLTYNSAVRMVGGKRYFGPGLGIEEGEAMRFQRVVRDFAYLFGVFVLSDAIPFLGWIDFNGYKKAMKKTAKELDTVIEGWLEEHKRRRRVVEGGGGEANRENDFMDVMLNILDDAKLSDFDADTINKATCLNLILAGSDTTMITLTWALSLLLNNRPVMEKVKSELEARVGKDRPVDEPDIKNLVYLQAVVKETLRLYPPSPIISLRASTEDCTFSTGHHIPAGTRLMVNAWKIHRDERVWPDPNEFRPERFLTSHKDVDLRGNNFELIPFGSGRRACPGISLGLRVVHLALASLLHCFDIAKECNVEDVDMSESLGLTNLKATPLRVYIAPCLNPNSYGY